jgi:glycosyltransferase involved in cell wall biosynthesis
LSLPDLIIFYDYFTPAYKAGGPTQSLYNLVKNLNGEPIKIVATNKDLDNTLLNVVSDKWEKFEKTKAQVWYASDASQPMVKEMIQEQSVLFINSLYSHHFDYPALIQSGAKRVIMSPRGMLDEGSLSQKSWKKKAYLAYWKLLGLHKRCEWHATTEQEKTSIQNAFGTKCKIWVVPNFPRTVAHQRTKKNERELQLVTVAVISPMKNHLLVLNALKKIPYNITYEIYGPIKDAAYWQSCQEVIASLPSHVKVSYKGDLQPDHLEQALNNAHVFIQPSKSENFGHSLFEAMTAGKPIITSHNTPWNELAENRAGVNVAIGDASEIEKAILFFAEMNDEEYKLWNESSRNYALSKTDMHAIQAGYRKMFEN